MCKFGYFIDKRNFNPRTREGCDKSRLAMHEARMSDFNPRTREGCDEIDGIGGAKVFNFNPRTREGCDRIFKPFTGFCPCG